jgi:hypothetical protein
MRRTQTIGVGFVLAWAALGLSTDAYAACTITSVRSVSGGVGNLGRYSGASAPVSQPVTLNFVLNVSGAGTCSGTFAANSAVLPAAMSGAGVDKLRYDVQNLSGTSILFSSTPGTAIPISANNSSGGATVSVTVQAQAIAIANQTLAAGGYSDGSVVLAVFDGGAPTVQVPGATSWFANAAVNPSCTIGGQASAVDPSSVRVPVSASGVVATAQIQRTYGSVQCNAPADITMASQNNGIRLPRAADAGFTNTIDYTAQATFGGATASLNTATLTLVTGKLNTTTGANGTMVVNITPQTPALPLMQGAYADVLTITLTPQ